MNIYYTVNKEIAMTRILTLLAALLIVIAGFILIRGQLKDSKPTEPVHNVPNAGSSKSNLNFHEWNEFSPGEGQFKVLLPAKPQHVSDVVVDQKTHEQRKYETFAIATDNGPAFMISVITLPESNKPSEESLKAAVTDMLERNKENKLINMKMGLLHDNPALDFSIGNKDVLIEGKVLAHDNKVYILSMLGKEGSFDKKEFDFFVNSFDFVDDIEPIDANVPQEKTVE